MAIMKTKQIREMKTEEISKKLADYRLELMKESGSAKMGRPIKNTGRIGELKRTIARILTVRNEKTREVKKSNA